MQFPNAVTGARAVRARCAVRARRAPRFYPVHCALLSAVFRSPPPGPRDVTGEACPLGRLEGEAAGEAARERRGQAHPRTREGEARGEATRTRRELLTCLALDAEGEGQEEEDRQAQKDDETEPVWCLSRMMELRIHVPYSNTCTRNTYCTCVLVHVGSYNQKNTER